ncbi:MAG: hypothetical protein N3A02_04175 [Rectinema sp.]|nr:hypothetical protein [Rectinema sp.]
MNIEFMLNGKISKVSITSADRAVDILANKCGIASLHPSCMSAHCGGCLILLESKPVCSCVLPAFLLRDHAVETLENFEETREYAALKAEFSHAALSIPPPANTALYLLGIWLIRKGEARLPASIEKALRNIHPWHIAADEFAAILEHAESRLGKTGVRS